MFLPVWIFLRILLCLVLCPFTKFKAHLEIQKWNWRADGIEFMKTSEKKSFSWRPCGSRCKMYRQSCSSYSWFVFWVEKSPCEIKKWCHTHKVEAVTRHLSQASFKNQMYMNKAWEHLGLSGQKAGPTPLHEHTSQTTSILNPLASERVSVFISAYAMSLCISP